MPASAESSKRMAQMLLAQRKREKKRNTHRAKGRYAGIDQFKKK